MSAWLSKFHEIDVFNFKLARMSWNMLRVYAAKKGLIKKKEYALFLTISSKQRQLRQGGGSYSN